MGAGVTRTLLRIGWGRYEVLWARMFYRMLVVSLFERLVFRATTHFECGDRGLRVEVYTVTPWDDTTGEPEAEA